jgi:phenylpropionate dioxygenase-like ring-hydroxylating dioxygenase large terminal subunit
MTAQDFASLTETEAAGIQVFEKPPVGSWTEAFGLDTGPVSFKGAYDPEFFELEKEAVFRRSWLNVGRVEDLPRPGTYFTKELEFLNVSVLVVQGMDGEIRAFHNVCSHRGNKLMWDDFPSKESSGNCRQIACKYHGWRYGLDGEVNYVHNAPEFFDLDAEDLALPKIHCEVWAGFIFVNLDDGPRESLRQFLTPSLEKLEGYPFDKMTRQWRFGGVIESNWKIFMDAFAEIYHVPYVHSTMNNPGAPPTGIDKVPMMIPSFSAHGKHRLFTSGGPHANTVVVGPRPLDAVFKCGLFGPMVAPDIGPLGDGVNPTGVKPWGLDSWQLYPNMVLLIWAQNYYYTYHYWPINERQHRFVFDGFAVPPKNAGERLALEHTMLTVRDFAFEDAATLAATQQALQSGARDEFHLGDQEVLVRHLHTIVTNDVEAYRRELQDQWARA